MLPTRSLPPQFLLPSWTASELALAVHRSYISSTATKSFQIKKHKYGSKHLTLYGPEQIAAQLPDIRSKGKKRRVVGSVPESPSPGIRHFKPYIPRPIPTPLTGFYVGKQYNGPDGEKLEGNRSRLSQPSGFPDGQHTGNRQTATLGQKRSEIGGQSRITLHGGNVPAVSSGYASGFESIQAKNGEQLVERQDGAEPSISSHRGLRNIPQHKGHSNYLSWKPEKPSPIAHEVTQQLSLPAETAIEPQELDMAGRWTDPTNPIPNSRSTKRLLWESDELLSTAKPLLKALVSTPNKTVSTHLRVTPFEPDPPKENISLFQELFPEESKTRRASMRLAEDRLDKLPAFAWDMDENFDQNWQTEREGRKAKLYEIPSRREPTDVPAQKIRHTMPTREEESIRTRRYEPSVVVMEGLSKYLEESDFFRIGPKGDHIEGWTSGILKVIPARDHTTLQPLGYYYLLFSSDAAARAYMDSTYRLHTLGKTRGPSSMPFMPPPPGTFREEESVKELLRSFSVLPRQNKLSMRLLNKPYRPGVLDMIDKGGPPALANRRAKGEALVLFSVDVGTITCYDIVYALKEDGRRRNMLWKFAGGKEVDISAVTYENRLRKDVLRENGLQTADKFKAPEKYIFAMKDMQEARRFVREWHRRPIEVVKRSQNDKLGQERLATVSAELLW